MAPAAHGWIGRGKVRMARFDEAVVVRLDGLTTQTNRIQRPIREFFRKEARGVGRDYRSSFAVTIWIEAADRPRRFDVDNVAKACLDALTGSLWRDDSQVVKLTVEKLAADRAAVTLLIEPAEAGGGSPELDRLLERIERL